MVTHPPDPLPLKREGGKVINKRGKASLCLSFEGEGEKGGEVKGIGLFSLDGVKS